MSFPSSYLFVLSLFLSFIDDTNHHKINNCTSEDVKHSLYFLGFFPCSPDSNRDLNECDMLTMSAVKLAIDKINQDPNILSCFKLELLSVHVNNPVKDPTEAFHIIHNQYTNLPFHGVIGPDHSNIAKLFGYIFGIHTYILQISYSVTDPSLEDTSRYPYFYATVPTDYRLNKAKQDILMHFNWKKVAVLSTDTDYHILISQQLTSILGGNPVKYIGSYTTSPNALLKDAKQHDFRIFIAVIDMKNGRSLLCSAYHNGITTVDHVWILPGIYNNKWWYLEGNDTTSNCTNEQILEAINSTLFVDTLSFDTTTTDLETINDVLTKIFNKSQVISGSQQSFEFRHLLHSKLLQAYDATMALALTWNNTLLKLSNNYTSEEIFALIDHPWNRPSLIDKELIESLKDSLENVVSPYQGLAGLHVFDHERGRDNSSNALITQLTGEYECVLRGFEGPFNSCNLTVCCNDSWKGGYLPTDGYCPNGNCVCRFISSYALSSIIVCSILLIIGIIISVVFFFVNLLLRNNKHFKASSPVHNCIMTVSCIFMLIAGVTQLVAFVIGITGSGKGALPYLCNASVGLFWFSLATINATALVKNWRIFRIFYNPEYKERKYLSNTVLNIGIVIIVLPIVVAIIALYCFNPIPKIDTKMFLSKCPNISGTQKTYVEEDTCLTYVNGWNTAFGTYLVVLFVILFIIGAYNCKILSSYKKEGEVATLTSAVSVLVLTFFNLAVSNLTVYSFILPRIETLIVLYCDSLSIYCIFILTFTYLPKLVAILRDKTRTRDSRISLYRRIFVQLNDDAANLKYSLDMIDNSIATLSTEKQLIKTKDLEQ